MRYRTEKLREKAADQAPIYTGEIVGLLAGLMRECQQLGPNTQDAICAHLEPLLEDLGLTEPVYKAAGLASAARAAERAVSGSPAQALSC